MIKTFEELGEVLADFENRLAYLESSMPIYNGERSEPAVTATPQASRDTLNDRRWESVKQLRAEVKFLRGKVTEKRIERKPKKRYEKYT